MTTLQITLDEETFERLKELAAGEREQSVDQMAAEMVKVLLQRAQRRAEIARICDEILEEYAGLFRRLAES